MVHGIELARVLDVATEDLVEVAHGARLPFMSIDGKLFVEPGDVPAWRKRCEQILGED
jgi:hypothetical protein